MTIIARGNRSDKEFEKVEIDVWINGTICEVQERLNQERPFKDKETGETKIRKVDEVRFVFELEGYEYKHRSRWMTLSTHDQSNLYKKYIKALFGNKFPPNSDLDVERLAGLAVKTMWNFDTYEDRITKKLKEFFFVDKIRLLNPDDANEIDLLIEEGKIDEEEVNLEEELGNG